MMTPERLAEPCKITAGAFCMTHWSRTEPRATACDLSDALREIDRLHDEIGALIEKYDNGKIRYEYNCCECNKPWVLYDEVMRNIRKLVGRDDG